MHMWITVSVMMMAAALMTARCSKKEEAPSALQQKAEEALQKASEASAAAVEAAKAFSAGRTLSDRRHALCDRLG